MNFQQVEKHIIGRLEKELPDNLYYHGLHHTRDVRETAVRIAEYEGVTNPDDLLLLQTATFYHDSGFMTHYKNHEDAGCDLARLELPGFGFSNEQIEKICGMIQATKIPQDPKTHLEQIICDADLDYLGRDDFEPIAKTLFEELFFLSKVKDEKEWNNIQLNFIKQHHYFTEYSRKFREEKKQKHLGEIIRIVESYVV